MGSEAIHGAMAAILAAIEPIAKTQRNQQQGFNFRGIDQVLDALHPVLAKHRVVVLPEVLEHRQSEYKTAKGTVMTRAVLLVAHHFISGEDGSSVRCVAAGEGSDSGDKATPKAMAVAYKYALFLTFCIPTGVDPDRDAPEGPGERGTEKRVGGPKIDEGEGKRLWNACLLRVKELREQGHASVTDAQIVSAVNQAFGLTRSRDLPKASLGDALSWIERWAPPKARDLEGEAPAAKETPE